MLSIERSVFTDGYEIITLSHEDKAINAGIIPGLGGMLNNFNIKGFEVVDGIALDDKGLQDYLNTFKSSLLLPYPNRIADGEV
jgi:galactose mutarotase-like enzyme